MNTVIEVRGLGRNKNDRTLLSDINFEIAKSRFFAVVGKSGSGKSELLKTLVNGQRVSSGNLFVLGLNAKNNYLSVKRKIGYVPQYSLLDSDFTVLDNLLITANFFGFNKKTALLKARESLRLLSLDDTEDIYVQNLTLFQKKCLTIAKAIINNPEILILDEPLINLNDEQAHFIIRTLKAFKSQKLTIVCSTRDPRPMFELADKVMFLSQGQKLVDGEPNDLIEEHVGKEIINFKAKKYDRYYYIQRIKDHYEYLISQDHIYIFIKANQNSSDVIKKINSEYIQVRKACLSDVYLKLSGHRLD